MSGVSKVEIAESVETLKSLMRQQKTALNHAKVQSLYLLKINVAETVRYLAVIMGRSESTIHYWLQLYKTGGITKLLEEPPQTGRLKKLEIEIVSKIQQELSDSEGFNSYKEVQLWLLVCQDIEISYPTVHRIVRYELTGKLKVARPIHEKQQPGIITAFKNHFPDRINSYYYMYGLVDPLNGRSFFYEFSHFNSNCLGAFLEQFSPAHSQEIHILQLDNAPVHTAHKLIVPDNVILFFQPPYCPELNPLERVWQYIKQRLKNLFFTNIDDVKYKVANILNSLSEDIIYSLTGWQYILDALSL
jgi:transposase